MEIALGIYGTIAAIWLFGHAVIAIAAGMTARDRTYFWSTRRESAQESIACAKRALLAPVWPAPVALYIVGLVRDVAEIAAEDDR